jgi:hypothetical protein
MNHDTNREDRTEHDTPHLWNLMRQHRKVCLGCGSVEEYGVMHCPCGKAEGE